MFRRRIKEDDRRQAEDAGLGIIERTVSLGGASRLIQTDRGLWLLEDDAPPIDLSEDGRLWMDSQRGRDRVHVGGRALLVPVGAGSRARHAVAFGRLARLGSRQEPPPDDPFIQPGFAVEEEWLRRSLAPDEEVLAWLETASIHLFEGPVLASVRAPLRYLLTPLRASLVAISEVGDVFAVALPPHTLAITDQVGRDTVLSGEEQWKATLGNASAYRAVAPAQAREGALRLLAVAGVHAQRTRGAKRGAARARELLDRAIAGGDGGAAPLAAAWLDARAQDAPIEALLDDPRVEGARRVLEGPRGGENLLRWARTWGLSPSDQVGLATGLRALHWEDGPLLPLHRHGWAALRDGAEGLERAALDAALARHLLAAGDPEAARLRATLALAELSPTSVDDLVAPSDGEAQGAVHPHALRVDLIETAAAAGEGGMPSAEALAELARLDPLRPARLQALIAASDGALRERAQTVVALLADPTAGAVWSPSRLRPLPPALIRSVLPHPAGRGGRGVDPLQRFLSREVEAPDYEALREYAERVDEAAHPELAAAVQDASLVLGQADVVEAYVSRGARVAGVRACEGPPPFVLVGVDHLRPGPLHLGPGELRFAVGAEIAHLRLGHARLTGQSLWDKVFEEGPSFLATLADFAPFIPVRGAALAKGLQLARLLPAGKLRPRRTRRGGSGELAVAWGDLLVACRVMQLTADRAGLLVSGDLGASLRGMLRTSAAGRGALGLAERHGLRQALHRPDEGGQPAPTQLALRVAALLGFWLSEDWPRLQDACRG